MTTMSKCPNPAGCDGDLYARAETGDTWCPKCGFVLGASGASRDGRHCPNPEGCDGELYARGGASDEAWCPKCGYLFSRGASA